MEIAGGIVDAGLHLITPAVAVQGNVQKETAQSAAEAERPAEPGHQLSAVGRLEQNVTLIELNHKASSCQGRFKITKQQEVCPNGYVGHYTPPRRGGRREKLVAFRKNC
jgi:hypothetical protein